MNHVTAKMLLLSGLIGLSAAVAASAAPAANDAPRLTVRYSPDVLATDSGARELYHRLNTAAARVCPNDPTNLMSHAVAECRKQALSAAVSKIHNQRLAAVYAANAKSG